MPASGLSSAMASNGTPGTRRMVAAVVLFAAIIGLSVSRVGLIDEVLGVDAGASWVTTDFYSGGGYPVRALPDGENPYDRARFLELYPAADGFPPYLPATLALHLPFGLLPVAPAAMAYFVATIALTLVLAWSAPRLGGSQREVDAATALVAAAIILATRPGHWNLMVGQRTLLYVLGTYAAVRFLHESPVRAAFGLALAMIKPTFVRCSARPGGVLSGAVVELVRDVVVRPQLRPGRPCLAGRGLDQHGRGARHLADLAGRRRTCRACGPGRLRTRTAPLGIPRSSYGIPIDAGFPVTPTRVTLSF